MTLRLRALIDALGGELHGDADRVIAGLAPLERASATELSFLADEKLAPLLATSQAGCVIVGPQLAQAAAQRDCIVAPDPLLYFARVTQLFRRVRGDGPQPGIHPSAVVEEGAHIDASASIGALCFVGRNARIGAHTILMPRVTLGHDCVLGARCIIHSGAVIGADGFGFAPNDGAWEKIEQFGAVRIGDDVQIGANTCVDRGALDDTVIEDGVKLDNLIQIGHNCHVGKHTAMAGCVGVAGSANIGAYCTVSGAGMIAGHITICDHVHVMPATMITHSVTKPGRYSGYFPVDEYDVWEKNAATLRHLYRLRERVRRLERALNAKSDDSAE
ncbi:MAG: UDP-3-O-(3-hydroxymyristoyl)glucosamine N-acyltransferase [Burkholderiaceae bacterium]|nr:MAG: UDP-3-O-(3-hydroxymyristoyl)glucosamine N-acyltransferase [Burkholderiaceae bacterium]